MARRFEQQGNEDASPSQQLDEPTLELFRTLAREHIEVLDKNTGLRRERIDLLVTNADLRGQVERLRRRLKAATEQLRKQPKILLDEDQRQQRFFNSGEQLPSPPYSPQLSAEEIEENIRTLTDGNPNNTETTPCIGGLIVDAHTEAEKDLREKNIIMQEIFAPEEIELLKVLIGQYHGLSLEKIAESIGLQKEKITQLTEAINEKLKDFQCIFKITIQNGVAIITLVTGNIFLLAPKPNSK